MNKIVKEDIEDIISLYTVSKWELLKNKTFLITGANGILASYIVFTLLYLNSVYNLNITVFALVRNIDKARIKFKEHLLNPYLKFIHQDIINEINCEEGIDYIIHAASQASPKYYTIDPVGTLNANIIGTHNVLKLAKEHNTKQVLFMSSGAIYGILEASIASSIKESDYGVIDPTNVRYCYEESKRMGENMCICWSYQFGIPIRIIRPFHTYGPGMDLDDGRVFADFINNIISGSDIILRSNGLAKRAFCYISDAIKGYFSILLDGRDGETYNVGNPKCEISMVDLANKLIKLFPEKQIKVIKQIVNENIVLGRKENERDICIPNIDKIMSLGWKPKVSLEEGFLRTIQSYMIK